VSEKRVPKKRRGPAGKPVEVGAAPSERDKTALTTRQASVILAVGLAFGLGVIYEWGPLNGFFSLTKWEWPWQDLGIIQMGLALLAPFLLIVGVAWSVDRPASRVPMWFWLAALVIANFCFQLFSVLADPRGPERIMQIVSSANATSYFTDALTIQHLRDWLSHFDRATLHGHSATHPAGPIVFYYVFARLFGPDVGALLGGCAVGLVASIGIVVMYHFAGLWTWDKRARLLASAFYALLPGLTVFFPELDQVYPIFSMLLILTFVKALSASNAWYRYALALGAVLFAASFFAYNLLTVGAFLLYYGMWWLWREGRAGAAAFTVIRTAAVSLIAAALLYLLLWATTGYNPPSALRHALKMQDATARWLGRPYHVFVLPDLYDFSLAAGIIVIPILWFHLSKLRDEFKANPNGMALTLIGLATVLTVDLSGLLRGETARVWLFLQPLLVVPVAVELARVRWPWRVSILTLQWWILVLIKAKMSFIEP
jgi:hypothetical protein